MKTTFMKRPFAVMIGLLIAVTSVATAEAHRLSERGGATPQVEQVPSSMVRSIGAYYDMQMDALSKQIASINAYPYRSSTEEVKNEK